MKKEQKNCIQHQSNPFMTYVTHGPPTVYYVWYEGYSVFVCSNKEERIRCSIWNIGRWGFL